MNPGFTACFVTISLYSSNHTVTMPRMMLLIPPRLLHSGATAGGSNGFPCSSPSLRISSDPWPSSIACPSRLARSSGLGVVGTRVIRCTRWAAHVQVAICTPLAVAGMQYHRRLDSAGNVVVAAAHTLVTADLGVLALPLLHQCLQLRVIALRDRLGLHLDDE